MKNQPQQPQEPQDPDIESQRKKRYHRIQRLHDYTQSYDADAFIEDLVRYFEDEVDFNLTKIRQRIREPGKLRHLIEKAKANKTHPVTEFVQELFDELGKSGDIEWSGQW
jgi:hypothetical protein